MLNAHINLYSDRPSGPVRQFDCAARRCAAPTTPPALINYTYILPSLRLRRIGLIFREIHSAIITGLTTLCPHTSHRCIRLWAIFGVAFGFTSRLNVSTRGFRHFQTSERNFNK